MDQQKKEQIKKSVFSSIHNIHNKDRRQKLQDIHILLICFS